ncbi:MAG: hypothetical protein AB9835_05370 [Eubacteriales bacterium]
MNQDSITIKINNSSPINAGGALVLTITAVLCVCVFGVLSFISAYSDRRLAEITRTSVQQYYLAEQQMENELALLDEALGQTGGLPLEDALSDVAKKMSEASVSFSEGKAELTNTVKYADNKKLTAIIRITKDEDENYTFNIKSWRSSPVRLPEYGLERELWDGES